MPVEKGKGIQANKHPDTSEFLMWKGPFHVYPPDSKTF
jgi:hypothetical protein